MRRMMALAELLPDVDVPRDIVVRGLTLDSRSVQPGDAFVAITGFGAHGVRVMEAVAARHAARRKAERLALDDLVAVQHDQPVRGAHEREVAVAPAHRLWYRQPLQCFDQDLGQQCRGRLSRLLAARDEPLALRIAGTLQLVDRDAVLRGEAGERRRRRTVCIEADVEVRAEHFGLLRRLPGGDARNQYRESPRRTERLRLRGIERDAAAREAVDDAARERASEFVERLRRQLFGAEFDQQGGVVVAHRAVIPGVDPRERTARARGWRWMPARAGRACIGFASLTRPRACDAAPGSRASRAARGTRRRRCARACARAGCSAGVRSR